MFDLLENTVSELPDDYKVDRIENISQILIIAANLAMGTAVAVALISFAFSFITLATAAGDPKKIAQGHRAIVYGAIGVLVSLSSFSFKAIIAHAFNITAPEVVGVPDF